MDRKVDLPKKIGVALCGAGRIGKVHFTSILRSEDFALKYVVDPIIEAAEAMVERAPYATATSSLQDALADEEVACVVICSPTAQHRDTIVAAAAAGKHIMCEKPISLELNEIDECYAICKANNVKLFCGYQRRHDKNFAKLAKLCHEGAIGPVACIRSCSRDWPIPTLAYLKISGGMVHDCGSHDIDICRWLAGEDPEEVFCFGSCFNKDIKKLDDVDVVLCTLKFPNGILASIDIARKAVYQYDQRIEVLGDDGLLEAYNELDTTVILSNREGRRADVNQYSFQQRYRETYPAELAHFAAVVRGECEPAVSHIDVRNVAIVADAANESMRTGKPVRPCYDL
eukprot:CAMPEP_0174261834 /NCGR_PEP_ID=MMETSP0439-20130205/12431_1 /TAXON_ID=0 /ORGANISM="Stereomyxa ramosa, Strain Chinc5" /LENGTH=342 /DNA_ID=CAMNT_0015346427 /DNA_START=55 /DNA_END=1083 /DNA_ORIENTATION=+